MSTALHQQQIMNSTWMHCTLHCNKFDCTALEILLCNPCGIDLDFGKHFCFGLLRLENIEGVCSCIGIIKADAKWIVQGLPTLGLTLLYKVQWSVLKCTEFTQLCKVLQIWCSSALNYDLNLLLLHMLSEAHCPAQTLSKSCWMKDFMVIDRGGKHR